MLHHLSIDLETFSSVPIAKAGAYKYIQSPDFESHTVLTEAPWKSWIWRRAKYCRKGCTPP